MYNANSSEISAVVADQNFAISFDLQYEEAMCSRNAAIDFARCFGRLRSSSASTNVLSRISSTSLGCRRGLFSISENVATYGRRHQLLRVASCLSYKRTSTVNIETISVQCVNGSEHVEKGELWIVDDT